MKPPLSLTVLIPTFNEAENLTELLPRLAVALDHITPSSWEILIVDGGSTDQTVAVSRQHGSRVVHQKSPGYGGAMKTGIEEAQGEYILTMDADLSHEPNFVYKLWENRRRADIVIASRYCRGGAAYMPWTRKWLSRILNAFFARGLSLPVRDLSSGFRIYRAERLKQLQLTGRNFEILEEILVSMHIQGGLIAEIPFTYFPRVRGSSHARIFKFGVAYLRIFWQMWKLRNSAAAADYDERAYYSLLPPQRYWQRNRHRVITELARTANRIIDIGCGSSIILQSLNRAVGLDISMAKMRHMRRYGLPVVNGSALKLPFMDQAADCVICSELIEHLPPEERIFLELTRILQPGGLLILGTPDYASWTWQVIEKIYSLLIPGGYADEHISHYDRSSLQHLLANLGYQILDVRYILRGELIIAARRNSQSVERKSVTAGLAKIPAPIGRRLRKASDYSVEREENFPGT